VADTFSEMWAPCAVFAAAVSEVNARKHSRSQPPADVVAEVPESVVARGRRSLGANLDHVAPAVEVAAGAAVVPTPIRSPLAEAAAEPMGRG